MALIPGSISAQGTAAALTGEELLAINQELGPVITATALVIGNSYRIKTLGTTNWAAVGATATPALGNEFRCDAVGTGTGTAQRIVTRTTTTQDVADLAAAGTGGGATNLSYDPATREIDSSSGTGAILPLAGAVIGGVAVAGLLPAAGAARLDQLSEGGTPTFTGLTVTGTATATQFDGNLTGAVSAHCRNTSGVSLAALTPLFVSGSQGGTTILEVVAARGDTPGLMPAAGLALAALGTSGSAAGGHLVSAGPIRGVNTAGLVSGQELFVAPAGGITPTQPTTGEVQVVATVGRVHANTGTVVVNPGPALSAVAFTGAYSDLSNRPGEISQAEAEAGAETVFRLWSAQRWRQAVAAWWASITSSTGRNLVAAADPAAARSVLELGSMLSAANNLADVASSSRAFNNLLSGGRIGILGTVPTTVVNGVGDVQTVTGTSTIPAYSSIRVAGASYSASGQSYLPTINPTYTGAAGRHTLPTTAEIYGGFNIVIPNLPTSGENWYGYIGGWSDTAATYTNRSAIGILINSSGAQAVATAAGTEVVSSAVTLVANTVYAVSFNYIASTGVLTVKIGSTTLTLSSGFPTVPLQFGLFAVKPAGAGGTATRLLGNIGGYTCLFPQTS